MLYVCTAVGIIEPVYESCGTEAGRPHSQMATGVQWLASTAVQLSYKRPPLVLLEGHMAMMAFARTRLLAVCCSAIHAHYSQDARSLCLIDTKLILLQSARC